LAETIESLVDPELMKRIPSFVRGHAVSGTAKLIAREYPELAGKAEAGTLAEADEERLRTIVNDIYQERMKKHNI
jgi:hypothetical protein